MNKFKSLSMYSVLTLITLVLLFGVYRTEKKLDGMIEEHHLRFTGSIENAPPLVTFTTMALGSFRGLIADFLWFRAAGLQEKGNYFEMVQLARWITDLQPTFSGATAYLAWNMAYNISVTCSDFGDRWRWVNEGIKLIRDRAIEYNPEDPILYKELAWIYQHKMGNIMDDANLYYKNQLAIQVQPILGATQDIPALAAAPADDKAFQQRYPAEHPFWTALAESGFRDLRQLYAAYREANYRLPETLATKLKDPEFTAGLENYLRSEALRRELKLDPAMMLEIENEYGKLDWRVAESHGIYWAKLGLRKTPGNRDLSLERLITQNLYETFRAGRLLMLDPTNFESIMTVPNLGIVDTVKAEYDKAYEQNDRQMTFYSAKVNFMKEAVAILYNYGQFSKAEEYYKELRSYREHDVVTTKNLEEFVMKRWTEYIRDATQKKASDAIAGMLVKSLIFLAYGDNDAALANERMARYIYKNYMEGTAAGQEERVGLLPYNQMRNAVVENALRNFPPAMATILRVKLSESATPVGPVKP